MWWTGRPRRSGLSGGGWVWQPASLTAPRIARGNKTQKICKLPYIKEAPDEKAGQADMWRQL